MSPGEKPGPPSSARSTRNMRFSWLHRAADSNPPRSIGHLAGCRDPFADQLLMLVSAHFRQAFGVEPGAVHAFRAEVVPGPERRRIVKRGNCQVHLVGILLEHEA